MTTVPVVSNNPFLTFMKQCTGLYPFKPTGICLLLNNLLLLHFTKQKREVFFYKIAWMFILMTVSNHAFAKTSHASLPLTATYTKTNVSVCGNGADGFISVTASGGTAPYTYSWTGTTGVGGVIPFTAGNVSTLSNLLIGYYYVDITDADMNTFTISGIHIEFAFAIYVTNSGSISSACGNTGSIILYGNAGVRPYTYSLDGITYQAGNTFINLAAGNYTGYMKDAAGCVSTKAITVTAAAPVTVTAFVISASSCASDGAVELYRTGGIPPYTYSKNGITYQAGNTFSGLAGGTVLTGWVKDSKGCIGSLPGITIPQGTGLNVTMLKTNTSTCVIDGTIQFNVTGGIPPFTYSLNNVTFQTGNTFSGLPIGHYFGYVKDSRGCRGASSTTIGLNPIKVTATVANATSCAANDGIIQVFQTGGTGSFTYSLDGNEYQASNTFTGLGHGIYSAFVKDGKVCVGVLNNIEVGPANCRVVVP